MKKFILLFLLSTTLAHAAEKQLMCCVGNHPITQPTQQDQGKDILELGCKAPTNCPHHTVCLGCFTRHNILKETIECPSPGCQTTGHRLRFRAYPRTEKDISNAIIGATVSYAMITCQWQETSDKNFILINEATDDSGSGLEFVGFASKYHGKQVKVPIKVAIRLLTLAEKNGADALNIAAQLTEDQAPMMLSFLTSLRRVAHPNHPSKPGISGFKRILQSNAVSPPNLQPGDVERTQRALLAAHGKGAMPEGSIAVQPEDIKDVFEDILAGFGMTWEQMEQEVARQSAEVEEKVKRYLPDDTKGN